jgi:hypothetical protein
MRPADPRFVLGLLVLAVAATGLFTVLLMGTRPRAGGAGGAAAGGLGEAVQGIVRAVAGSDAPCSSGEREDFRADPGTPIREGTIFVSIAAYRDDECKDTVYDLFERAARPDRIFVGVVQQTKLPEEDCFERCEKCRERKRSGHIRQIDFDFSQARGPCYARYQASKLWRGEQYYMQIDSHTKFEEGWDEVVFAELARTQDPAAVLGAYPPTEEQMDGFKKGGFGQMIMNCTPEFNDDGLMNFQAAVVDSPPGPLERRARVPVPFSGANLLVMPAQALLDVPFDPHLNFLFFGEELLHSARLWTAGYNIYAPVQSFVRHHYGRGDKPKFWSDMANFETCRRKAVKRAKYHLGLGPLDEVDPEYRTDIGQYGAGARRSLEEYWRFAGVDWAKRTAERRCSWDGYGK